MYHSRKIREKGKDQAAGIAKNPVRASYYGKLLCRDCAGLDSAVYTALTDIDQIRTDVERDKGVAMKSAAKNNKWNIIVILLFAGSVLLRSVIGNFPKTLRIYLDELRYVSIARNLFQGQGV